MKLVHTSDYAIHVIRESTSEVEPLCEIIVDGAASGKVLQGAVFEAALKWHEYVLLFLTDDVPFENGLGIYLLDQNLNVADYARMYFMYSTGIFSDLDLSENDTVHFRFFGGDGWTIRLYRKKKLTIPISLTPLGVHRPLTFFRRFDLRVRQSASHVPPGGSLA